MEVFTALFVFFGNIQCKLKTGPSHSAYSTAGMTAIKDKLPDFFFFVLIHAFFHIQSIYGRQKLRHVYDSSQCISSAFN